MSAVQFLCPPGGDVFLDACLRRDTSQVVSLVGAGGKTSTLFWLAGALYQRGLRVVLTTTTRMHYPDPRFGVRCVIEKYFPERLAATARFGSLPGVMTLLSTVDENLGKAAGCLPQEVDSLKAAGVADVILVEADGAKHQAIKAPASHEPCIPESSDAVIALTGSRALLSPVRPECVHRWPEFAAITGVSEGDVLDADVINRLIEHPDGMFKGAPFGARRHWLVNGELAGNPALLTMLESIASAHDSLDGVWQGNMHNAEPLTHAWLRVNRKQKETQ